MFPDEDWATGTRVPTASCSAFLFSCSSTRSGKSSQNVPFWQLKASDSAASACFLDADVSMDLHTGTARENHSLASRPEDACPARTSLGVPQCRRRIQHERVEARQNGGHTPHGVPALRMVVAHAQTQPPIRLEAACDACV
eukprot:scaffold874_cov233-Pinguiococcus_pyrenoidosus.AAC.8